MAFFFVSVVLLVVTVSFFFDVSALIFDVSLLAELSGCIVVLLEVLESTLLESELLAELLPLHAARLNERPSAINGSFIKFFIKGDFFNVVELLTREV